MNYLVYRAGYSSTPKAMAAMSQGGLVAKRDDKVRLAPRDRVIRWGTTKWLDGMENDPINPAGAIRTVSDKPSFRMLCQREGIRVPRTWPSIDEAVYPFIVRPRRHIGGRSLYLCLTREEAENAREACGSGYYCSQYIPKLSEYRVHVVDNRILGIQKKVPSNPTDISWNHTNGARFVRIAPERWRMRVVRQALKAFRLAGLDFGAVDVILNNRERPFVLEINTAPALQDWFTACYAKALVRLTSGHMEQGEELPRTYSEAMHADCGGEE